MDEHPPLLTIDEAAEMLRIGRSNCVVCPRGARHVVAESRCRTLDRSQLRARARQRMGVAKNTAQRALVTLRAARLVEFDQQRGGGGRFDASAYRLDVPDVLTLQPLQRAAAARSSRRSKPGTGGRVGAASPAGGFDEQLVLLPLA